MARDRNGDMPARARETGAMAELPEDRQQHLDEQTAHANATQPGGSKMGALRRIDRWLREQRRRVERGTGHETGERPPKGSGR